MSATTVEMPSETLAREINALSTAVLGIDASRRVGWAKAFDALRRVEAMEEEIRQLRDEQKWMRRAYSRLLGVVQESRTPRSSILDEELAHHFAAERTFRHDDAWDAGIAVGRRHMEIVNLRKGKRYVKTESKARRFREMRSVLFAEGRNAGHAFKMSKAADREGVVYASAECSCSASFAGLEREVWNWLYDHIASGIGRDFEEYRAAYYAEHPTGEGAGR